jgi:hypothetical protein
MPAGFAPVFFLLQQAFAGFAGQSPIRFMPMLRHIQDVPPTE